MTKLLLLADDLTGALDTGVFFSGFDAQLPLDGQNIGSPCHLQCLHTRHLSASDAKDRTMQALSSVESTYIYLKTDSLLRGHIGAALEALVHAHGTVFFAPAYPATGRTTKDGVVYVHGTRLSETAAAQDPLNPVKSDRASEIIAQESAVETCSITPGAAIPEDFHGVLICDAASDNDLRMAAEQALALGIHCFAGCAGFAQALSRILDVQAKEEDLQFTSSRLLVLSASIHPATLEQLSTARSFGLPGVWLYEGGHSEDVLASATAKTLRLLKSSSFAMLAAAFNDMQSTKNTHYFQSRQICKSDAAKQITAELAACAARVLSRAAATAFVIGGDTLLAFCEKTGIVRIIPRVSLAPGVIYCRAVDSRGREKSLITKSGGFGDAACILDLADQFAK